MPVSSVSLSLSSRLRGVFFLPERPRKAEKSENMAIKYSRRGVVTSLLCSSCSVSSLRRLSDFQTVFNKTTTSPLSQIKPLSLEPPDLKRASHLNLQINSNSDMRTFDHIWCNTVHRAQSHQKNLKRLKRIHRGLNTDPRSYFCQTNAPHSKLSSSTGGRLMLHEAERRTTLHPSPLDAALQIFTGIIGFLYQNRKTLFPG